MKRILAKSFYLALATLLLLYSWLLFSYDFSSGKEIKWGVTFSAKYAEELGLDWQEVYLRMLDDLGVKYLRIPVYWSEIEKKPGQFDFRDIDWQLAEANKRGAQVILAVGYRVPRWPECHAPSWAKDLPQKVFRQRVENLLKQTILHTRVFSNIYAWQVNNEPFLESFGDCRSITKEELAQDIGIVKALDNKQRKIVLTESGELSTWIKSAGLADVIGTSLYRTVWNKYIGYFRYPLPPAFYRFHADLITKNFPVEKVIISELQAEPWPPGKSILQTSISEQMDSFDLELFKHNIDYARRTGIDEIYLWGVEWWYWMKERGKPEFWLQARELFR